MLSYFQKAGLLVFISILNCSQYAFSQIPINFVIDNSTTNRFVLDKPLALKDNKIALFTYEINNAGIKLHIVNNSGAVEFATEISQLINWPTTNRNHTVLKAIALSNGNLLLVYFPLANDYKINSNAQYLVLTPNGTKVSNGTLNSTTPLNVSNAIDLTRFISLTQLSDGKIVALFQRTDNKTYAFRILSSEGIPQGSDVVIPVSNTNYFRNAIITSNQTGGFLITFKADNMGLSGTLYNNSGNIEQVGGANHFQIYGATGSGYGDLSSMHMANGNYLIVFSYGYGNNYYIIISPTGNLITPTPVLLTDGAEYEIGSTIPVNTPGKEGFLIPKYYDEGGDKYSYSFERYSLSGTFVESYEDRRPFIENYAFMIPSPVSGFGYLFAYQKNSAKNDGDIIGVMNSFVTTTLPVTLLSFTATLTENNRALLKWRTSVESLNSHFIVERSSDGANFSSIGRVEGKGTTLTSGSYSYTDQQSVAGTTYYRIKQYDYDGKEKSLGVRVIRNQSTASIRIFPNPSTHGLLNIETPLALEGVSYKLINSIGNVVLQGKIARQLTQINTSGLLHGMYFLRIGSEEAFPVEYPIVNDVENSIKNGNLSNRLPFNFL